VTDDTLADHTMEKCVALAIDGNTRPILPNDTSTTASLPMAFNITHTESSIGPTVFRSKFCQIPWASSQNSAANHEKIVQIPWLIAVTAAFCLCVN